MSHYTEKQRTLASLYGMTVEAYAARFLKEAFRCCPMDDDGDGNCAIHESPGVMRPYYRGLTDEQARHAWKQMNYLRNYSNVGRNAVRNLLLASPYEGKRWTSIYLNNPINEMPRRAKMAQSDPVMDRTNERYTLQELWPHKGFVKPIYHLATPHLENIVELFSDENKFFVASDGRARRTDEVRDLRARVSLVRKVLKDRQDSEQQKLRDHKTQLTRRINDTKIQLNGFMTRHMQPCNGPTPVESDNMFRHCYQILIDIQLEFGLV